MDSFFTYNGIPVYNVGFHDFHIISNCFESGSRLMSNNLQNKELSEKIKSFGGHTLKVGVFFEGVMLDLRELKKK